VNEHNRPIAWPVGIAEDLPERLWSGEGAESAAGDKSGVDPTAGVASMSFIFAAIGRRRKLWLSLAFVGLLVGLGLTVVKAPAYQAKTAILLAYGPNQNPQYDISTNAALASSTAVGTAAVKQLGLTESVPTFLQSSVVTEPTNEVLVITVTAPTSAEAVQRANAVAASFLKIHAQYAEEEQSQQDTYLSRQVALAQQNLNAIDAQLTKAQSAGESQSQTANLRQQQQNASSALATIQTQAAGTTLTTRTQTQFEIKDTVVVNPAAPVHKSKTKSLLMYGIGGLLGGMVLGVAIIAIGAVLSDKLRRRDDVAYATGVPVRLSLGPLRRGRLPGQALKAGTRERDMERLVRYLRSVIPAAPGQGGNGRRASGEPSSLAVVAMSDPRTVAEAVVSLATVIAQNGGRVLLADLSNSRDAARLLGVGEPGITKVNQGDAELLVALPDTGDVTPAGPLRGGPRQATGVQPSEDVLSAASAVNLLLTLVTLDPAYGGDHLGTWATTAVAVVTAGDSSALRIRANAEMVQLGGARLDSVVLVGADKNDESLGAWDPGD
jgi:capsular polysaccharide biosynthesis protein